MSRIFSLRRLQGGTFFKNTILYRRILITGGSGFLGGHLIQQACRAWKVYATYWNHSCELKGIHWIGLNLADVKSIPRLFKTIKPQVVIHTAALTSVDYCQTHKKEACIINIQATEALAKAAEEYNARFIYVSTDMVFNGKKGNYSEEDLVDPINFYGETKCIAEEKVKANSNNFVIARSALMYGTPLTGEHSFSEWILRKLKNEETVPLYYDQYRTPVLSQNLAQALLELAEMDFVGLIHLGGAQRINRYDFGVKLAQAAGFPTTLLTKCSAKEEAPIAPRPEDVSFNISKAQNLLSTNLLSCDEGLKLL